ncbi:Uncharacterized protein TCAP_04919 [Tolypocladium capitatum]|uniref:Uncharacterized protein n=1 Tax=Tolypocladium capitatum TaxID=45235 RepID=A0A2K3QC86_9HYPO|nr:Uncharacterized protein TCAP_04919 [Tolypocladium capitatum]
MQFGISVVLLASALGAMANSLPVLQLAGDDGIRAPATGDVNAEAFCPPSFPRYCPVGNFCCRTSKCCRASCCLEIATYCGSDGNCYR